VDTIWAALINEEALRVERKVIHRLCFQPFCPLHESTTTRTWMKPGFCLGLFYSHRPRAITMLLPATLVVASISSPAFYGCIKRVRFWKLRTRCRFEPVEFL
jgi:hypothetical protein